MRLSDTPTDYLIVRAVKPKGAYHACFVIVPISNQVLQTLRNYDDPDGKLQLHRSYALFQMDPYNHKVINDFLDHWPADCAWIELSNQEWQTLKSTATFYDRTTMAFNYQCVRWMEISGVGVMMKTADLDRIELVQEVYATM